MAGFRAVDRRHVLSATPFDGAQLFLLDDRRIEKL